MTRQPMPTAGTLVDVEELREQLAEKEAELDKLKAVGDLIETAQALAGEMEKMGPENVFAALRQLYDGVATEGEQDYACKPCAFDSKGVCQHPHTDKLPGNVPYMAPEVRPRCQYFVIGADQGMPTFTGPLGPEWIACDRCEKAFKPREAGLEHPNQQGIVCPDCYQALEEEAAQAQEEQEPTGDYVFDTVFGDDEFYDTLCCDMAKELFRDGRAWLGAQQKSLGDLMGNNTELHRELEDRSVQIEGLQDTIGNYIERDKEWRKRLSWHQKLCTRFNESQAKIKELETLLTESLATNKAFAAEKKAALKEAVMPTLAKERMISLPDEELLVEALAEIQHNIWASWMDWLFKPECGNLALNNEFVINAAKVERWKRQLETSYVDLSPEEQVSDQRVVREHMGYVLDLMKRAKASEMSKQEWIARALQGDIEMSKAKAENVAVNAALDETHKAKKEQYKDLTDIIKEKVEMIEALRNRGLRLIDTQELHGWAERLRSAANVEGPGPISMGKGDTSDLATFLEGLLAEKPTERVLVVSSDLELPVHESLAGWIKQIQGLATDEHGNGVIGAASQQDLISYLTKLGGEEL
jgi:hypothetical protein